MMADEDWRENIIENKLGGKRDWTDDERAELAHVLDKQLDSHGAEQKEHPIPQEERWTEGNWKEKMAEHPIFMPYLKDGEQGDAPVNALSEGLAQLKFHPDHNTPEEVAKNYKEDGNHHFKYKKYRLAVASYSEGLKQNCSDKELNTQLLSNRAAAQICLENYRSAISDCESVLKIFPDYRKAFVKAIDASSRLKSWDEVIKWCDIILKDHPEDEEILSKRKAAVHEKKKQARDERKKQQVVKQKDDDAAKLLQLIKIRGINWSGIDADGSSTSECVIPYVQGSRVHINEEDGCLMWPVRFLYPEHKVEDFIAEFHEQDRFCDHLNEMFGKEVAPWDLEKKYKVLDLRIFFEDSTPNLHEIDSSSTLLEVISKDNFCVAGGAPFFIILVNNSEFITAFLQHYKDNKINPKQSPFPLALGDS